MRTVPSVLSLAATLALSYVTPFELPASPQASTPIVVLAAPSQVANQKLGSFSISTLRVEQARNFARENHWHYQESGGIGFLIDSFGSGLHFSRVKLLAHQAMKEGKIELETDKIGELGTLLKLLLAGSTNLSSDAVMASNIKFNISSSDRLRLVASDGTVTAALVHNSPTEPQPMPKTTELSFVVHHIGEHARKHGRNIYPGNVKLTAAFSHLSDENAQNELRDEGLRIVLEILDENEKEVDAIKKWHFGGLSKDWQIILARAEEKANLSSLSNAQKDLLLSRVVDEEKIPALRAGGKFEGVFPVLFISVLLKSFGGHDQHIRVIL